jgi:hypothetical protein
LFPASAHIHAGNICTTIPIQYGNIYPIFLAFSFQTLLFPPVKLFASNSKEVYGKENFAYQAISAKTFGRVRLSLFQSSANTLRQGSPELVEGSGRKAIIFKSLIFFRSW